MAEMDEPPESNTKQLADKRVKGKSRWIKVRKKQSRLSEVMISVLIGVILVTSILSSIPSSTLKSAVAPVFTPIARAAGLDQHWGMFSPNPPRVFVQLEVHVIMSNSEDRVWRPQDDSSMPGLYWRKIKEEVIKHKEFRPGLAAWVVRHLTRRGERPARVMMIATVESVPLPGKGAPEKDRKLIFDRKLSSGGTRTPA
jgi:hypothetical protein